MDNEEVTMISNGKTERRLIEQDRQIADRSPFEEFDFVIKDWVSDRSIRIETHFFNVKIRDRSKGREWTIQRRYSDFEWLFKALKFSYPGCILPYFPTKTIENYMVTKLGIQYGEQSKQQHLLLRRDELEMFLIGICRHGKVSQAEELRIFLSQNQAQFQKNRKAIESQISESQTLQSSTFGIVSIWERGMAWISSTSSSTADRDVTDIQGWEETEKEIRFWVNQVSSIMEKVEKLIELKSNQIEWQGPDTEIDSVEELKAKIISGRQFNQIFQQQLKENIVTNIQYDIKCLKQLQEQLGQREAIISIINYTYQFTSDANRVSKLVRKKEKMERNLGEEWSEFREQVKMKVCSLQKKFNELWRSYCKKINSIWRKR